MHEKDACGDLSDEGTLASHIWSSDNLHVGLVPLHLTIVRNALAWIHHFNEGMSRFMELQFLVIRASLSHCTDLWSYILVMARD